jgi:hypothetical protein
MPEKPPFTKADMKKLADRMFPHADPERKIRSVLHVMENYGRADISDTQVRWITEAVSGLPYEEYERQQMLKFFNWEEE